VIQFIGSGTLESGPPRPQALALSGSRADGKRRLRDPGLSPPLRGPELAGQGQSRAGLEALQAPSNPDLLTSFDGLTNYDRRFARGGNQFSLGEPPDQGLCVGNGYVLESVNTVLRVYDTKGKALTKAIAMSEFYGYPPEIDRETGIFGPATFDISCYYDPETRRWFHVGETLDDDPATGAATGRGRLDLAVSQTANPLGRWNFYAIPTQNDGTEGTPDHGCDPPPCFSDFPHVGADHNGFYITANEFALFGDEFTGANLYAIAKRQLAAGARRPNIVQFETVNYPFGGPAYTVWPAVAPDGLYEREANGTEYFLSRVTDVLQPSSQTDNRIVVWALTNTGSLEDRNPSPRLNTKVIRVTPYSAPSLAEQPPGPIPLAECINDTTTPTPFGTGCWRNFFLPEFEPAHDEVESQLDADFPLMFQVYFAAGRLWSSQPTVVTVGGQQKAGIAYYIVRPKIEDRRVEASLQREDQFGVRRNNLLVPAVGVTKAGKGVISFSLVGRDHYPSAAYAGLDATHGIGKIHVAAEGLGPIDGFSGYKAFGEPVLQRFGDYGAAVADGDTIWTATEYIGQRCTLKQYLKDTARSPLFTCGKTRSAFGNWYTRISKIRP
jgi:hypothetical protein